MLKRNTILHFVVPVIILIIISLIGYYFYKKSNSVPPPLTKEQIEEQQRNQLMSYTLDPEKQKSEDLQKKELQLFETSSQKDALTEEEMRAVLTSEETNL